MSESSSGTWEASSTVCESDTLCDPTVLISANNPEPHIRNRRLSPGSGSCGGGGGGGCVSEGDKNPRQISPEGNTTGTGHTHTVSFRKEKERKGLHKGRSRESQKGNNRANERPQKGTQKERWVEDSLSLLKPPPAFPVQDSPAKLQPAVSYASKVKAKTASGILAEERPAIGVLLQNQWGLSFISETEARPSAESPGPLATQTTDADPQIEPQPDTVLRAAPPEETPVQATSSAATKTQPEAEESSEKMLLSCRHLVEALSYHSRGELWGFAFNVPFLGGVNVKLSLTVYFCLPRMECCL